MTGSINVITAEDLIARFNAKPLKQRQAIERRINKIHRKLDQEAKRCKKPVPLSEMHIGGLGRAVLGQMETDGLKY